MIVDDDDINRLLLTQQLSSNVKLVEFSNGKDAVDYVKNNDVDLILMDIKMPIMDGIEATKLIKQVKPTIPIIVISGLYGRSIDVTFGFDDILIKPYNENVLLDTVNKYCN